MPLIKGKTDMSRSKNIATEVRSGKPTDQAAAIAYSIQRKAKQKKMAQGGWVEAEPKQEEHFLSTNEGEYSEAEPKQHDLHGTEFTEANIGQAGEKYDVEPGLFNKGGMCYAKGGEVGPMAMLLRARALKKMAYGGLINETHGPSEEEDDAATQKLSENGVLSDENYPPYLEQDEQTEARMEGTQSPAHMEASDKDEDRVAFLRHMAVKRAMRGKAE